MKKQSRRQRYRRCTAVLLAIIMMVGILPADIMGIRAEAASTSAILNRPQIKRDSSMEANQKVIWDCVWFGSYPQSEVTSEDEVYTALQSTAEWSGNETTIDGIKYRRMKKGDAANAIDDEEEYYKWTDDTTYHYFKYTKIKWRVLDVADGKAFLLADLALDNRRYNETDNDVTWYSSTLRTWLNDTGWSGSFMNSAFTKEEQSAIVDTYLTNEDNSYYETEGGRDTTDKVYLLSESDVYLERRAALYGFVRDEEISDEGRRAKSSDYAKAMGIYTEIVETDYSGNCMWWLRTPGVLSSYAGTADYDGYVDIDGADVDNASVGVRPALWLDLSSWYWGYAGNVCSRDGEEANGKEFRKEGDYFRYGDEKKGRDYFAEYFYSDAYFENSSYNFQQSLATMSMSLAWSAFASADIDGYPQQSRNLANLLYFCGFDADRFWTNQSYQQKPLTDSIGVGASSKSVNINGENYTLIAAAVRGGGYESEWAGNFKVGENGYHKGFEAARDQVLTFLQEYIDKYSITGKIKLWIAGYSRAAATTNLVAGAIDENPALFTGVNLDRKDLYAYCFETPAGAIAESDAAAYSTGVHSEIFDNIFSIVNPNDVVTKVAPSCWKFTRYGIDKMIVTKFDAVQASTYTPLKRDMLGIYERLGSIADSESAENGTHYVVDDFEMKDLNISGHNLNAKKYHNYTQGVYLDDFIRIAFQEFLQNRSNYVSNYENKIRIFSKWFFGNEAFKSALKSEVNILNAGIQLVTRGEDKFKQYVSDGIERALSRAGIADCPRSEINAMVDAIGDLLWDIISNHPIYAWTLAANVEGIGAAHYPELCYSWLCSADANYMKNGGNGIFTASSVYRRLRVNCPVDVSVYDRNGRLVAEIVNDVPQDVADSTAISSVNENGEKEFILPSVGEYTVQICAADNGKVSYSILEYSSKTGTFVRTVNYYDIQMKKGEILTGILPEITGEEQDSGIVNGSSAEYRLTDTGGNEIAPDLDVSGDKMQENYYQVTAVSDNESYGAVLGGGLRLAGEWAELTAVANDGYEFDGWYVGGKLVSTETEYRFRVEGDTEVTGVFKVSDKKTTDTVITPPAITPPTEVPPVKVGSTIFAGKLKYKITKACVGGKGGTVAVTAPVNKKLSKVTIPQTVKTGGVSYTVTSIGAKAFKGCSKLKKLTIKTRNLKKVGANAFKGIHKKAKIKVPKAKLKAYKKLLKKKGQAKTVTIKK